MSLLRYLLKRLIAMVPTLFGITVITFLLINIAPGGPIDQVLEKMKLGRGQTTAATAGGMTFQDQRGVSDDVMDALKKQYGFDKPLHERYFMWIGNLARLDFGTSHLYGRPVLQVIKERLGVSLQFGVTSLILTYSLAIAVGSVMARYAGRSLDRAISFFLIGLAAIPAFALAISLLIFLAGGSFLQIFPLGYLQSENYEQMGFLARVWDRVHHFTLPLICYMVGAFASLSFLSRNSLVDELSKDYVRTARAFGFSDRIVFMRHALRNALIPVVTGIGGSIAAFIGGSLIVETIFQLDGIGLLGFRALVARDYNLIMGLMLIQSAALLVGNLIGDFLYMLVDPRIDFTAEEA